MSSIFGSCNRAVSPLRSDGNNLRLVALLVGGLPVRESCAPAEIEGLTAGSAEFETPNVERRGCLAVAEVGPSNAAARASVDLNKLIREVLAFAQGEHQTWPIEVHTDLDENLLLVPGDRVQLQQVIFNLITNAIDAMDTVIDRTRSLRVTSELKGSNGVVVKIADTGTGIAPENIDRIFDTFFTTKSHGMGNGSRNLPLNYRSSRRNAVGVAGVRAWSSLPAYFAGWHIDRRITSSRSNAYSTARALGP